MKHSALRDEEPIPAVARSRDGVEFDPRLDQWSFRTGVDQILINFDALECRDMALLSSVRKVLLWYVVNRSGSLANGVFQRFLHFLRWHGEGEPITEVGAGHILNYRSSLDSGQQWYLTALSGALRKWHGLGHPGVGSDAIELLEKLKLRGNRKGEAVRTSCPFSGPLTDIEFTGVVTGLTRSFRNSQITRGQYLLASLCIGLGLRPVQLASLKTCDLLPGPDEHAAILRVPRAKQRGQLTRAEFKERPLVAGLAREFREHVREVEAWLRDDTCPAGTPMFPDEQEAIWATGFEWHCTRDEISRRARECMESLGVRSERTGLPLRLFPTRLRRTLGTRAAAEGRGLMVIAEMLDHSDLQNVAVYAEARPDIVDRLSEVMASSMAPLARAFMGDIGDEAAAGMEPGGRIADPRFGARKALGKCRSTGSCALLAPTGCYTCPSFRAWRDGPHTTVLDYLIKERDRLLALTDPRIAAVNDRTILAVAEVVALCGTDRDV